MARKNSRCSKSGQQKGNVCGIHGKQRIFCLDYAIIKKKGYSIDDIKSAVISCILQEERISSVDSVSVEVNDKNRTVDIGFTATIDNEQVAGEVSV